MKRSILVFVFFLVCAACILPVHNAYALRCQNGQLISVGDSVLEVIECLGEPAHKNYKTVKTGSGNNRTYSFVEEWFYKIDDVTYCISILEGKVSEVKNMGRF